MWGSTPQTYTTTFNQNYSMYCIILIVLLFRGFAEELISAAIKVFSSDLHFINQDLVLGSLVTNLPKCLKLELIVLDDPPPCFNCPLPLKHIVYKIESIRKEVRNNQIHWHFHTQFPDKNFGYTCLKLINCDPLDVITLCLPEQPMFYKGEIKIRREQFTGVENPGCTDRDLPAYLIPHRAGIAYDPKPINGKPCPPMRLSYINGFWELIVDRHDSSSSCIVTAERSGGRLLTITTENCEGIWGSFYLGDIHTYLFDLDLSSELILAPLPVDFELIPEVTELLLKFSSNPQLRHVPLSNSSNNTFHRGDTAVSSSALTITHADFEDTDKRENVIAGPLYLSLADKVETDSKFRVVVLTRSFVYIYRVQISSNEFSLAIRPTKLDNGEPLGVSVFVDDGSKIPIALNSYIVDHAPSYKLFDLDRTTPPTIWPLFEAKFRDLDPAPYSRCGSLRVFSLGISHEHLKHRLLAVDLEGVTVVKSEILSHHISNLDKRGYADFEICVTTLHHSNSVRGDVRIANSLGSSESKINFEFSDLVIIAPPVGYLELRDSDNNLGVSSMSGTLHIDLNLISDFKIAKINIHHIAHKQIVETLATITTFTDANVTFSIKPLVIIPQTDEIEVIAYDSSGKMFSKFSAPVPDEGEVPAPENFRHKSSLLGSIIPETLMYSIDNFESCRLHCGKFAPLCVAWTFKAENKCLLFSSVWASVEDSNAVSGEYSSSPTNIRDEILNVRGRYLGRTVTHSNPLVTSMGGKNMTFFFVIEENYVPPSTPIRQVETIIQFNCEGSNFVSRQSQWITKRTGRRFVVSASIVGKTFKSRECQPKARVLFHAGKAKPYIEFDIGDSLPNGDSIVTDDLSLVWDSRSGLYLDFVGGGHSVTKQTSLDILLVPKLDYQFHLSEGNVEVKLSHLASPGQVGYEEGIREFTHGSYTDEPDGTFTRSDAIRSGIDDPLWNVVVENKDIHWFRVQERIILTKSNVGLCVVKREDWGAHSSFKDEDDRLYFISGNLDVIVPPRTARTDVYMATRDESSIQNVASVHHPASFIEGGWIQVKIPQGTIMVGLDGYDASIFIVRHIPITNIPRRSALIEEESGPVIDRPTDPTVFLKGQLLSDNLAAFDYEAQEAAMSKPHYYRIPKTKQYQYPKVEDKRVEDCITEESIHILDVIGDLTTEIKEDRIDYHGDYNVEWGKLGIYVRMNLFDLITDSADETIGIGLAPMNSPTYILTWFVKAQIYEKDTKITYLNRRICDSSRDVSDMNSLITQCPKVEIPEPRYPGSLWSDKTKPRMSVVVIRIHNHKTHVLWQFEIQDNTHHSYLGFRDRETWDMDLYMMSIAVPYVLNSQMYDYTEMKFRIQNFGGNSSAIYSSTNGTRRSFHQIPYWNGKAWTKPATSEQIPFRLENDQYTPPNGCERGPFLGRNPTSRRFKDKLLTARLPRMKYDDGTGLLATIVSEHTSFSAADEACMNRCDSVKGVCRFTSVEFRTGETYACYIFGSGGKTQRMRTANEFAGNSYGRLCRTNGLANFPQARVQFYDWDMRKNWYDGLVSVLDDFNHFDTIDVFLIDDTGISYLSTLKKAEPVDIKSYMDPETVACIGDQEKLACSPTSSRYNGYGANSTRVPRWIDKPVKTSELIMGRVQFYAEGQIELLIVGTHSDFKKFMKTKLTVHDVAFSGGVDEILHESKKLVADTEFKFEAPYPYGKAKDHEEIASWDEFPQTQYGLLLEAYRRVCWPTLSTWEALRFIDDYTGMTYMDMWNVMGHRCDYYVDTNAEWQMFPPMALQMGFVKESGLDINKDMNYVRNRKSYGVGKFVSFPKDPPPTRLPMLRNSSNTRLELSLALLRYDIPITVNDEQLFNESNIFNPVAPDPYLLPNSQRQTNLSWSVGLVRDITEKFTLFHNERWTDHPFTIMENATCAGDEERTYYRFAYLLRELVVSHHNFCQKFFHDLPPYPPRDDYTVFAMRFPRHTRFYDLLGFAANFQVAALLQPIMQRTTVGTRIQSLRLPKSTWNSDFLIQIYGDYSLGTISAPNQRVAFEEPWELILTTSNRQSIRIGVIDPNWVSNTKVFAIPEPLMATIKDARVELCPTWANDMRCIPIKAPLLQIEMRNNPRKVSLPTVKIQEKFDDAAIYNHQEKHAFVRLGEQNYNIYFTVPDLIDIKFNTLCALENIPKNLTETWSRCYKIPIAFGLSLKFNYNESLHNIISGEFRTQNNVQAVIVGHTANEVQPMVLELRTAKISPPPSPPQIAEQEITTCSLSISKDLDPRRDKSLFKLTGVIRGGISMTNQIIWIKYPLQSTKYYTTYQLASDGTGTFEDFVTQVPTHGMVAKIGLNTFFCSFSSQPQSLDDALVTDHFVDASLRNLDNRPGNIGGPLILQFTGDLDRPLDVTCYWDGPVMMTHFLSLKVQPFSPTLHHFVPLGTNRHGETLACRLSFKDWEIDRTRVAISESTEDQIEKTIRNKCQQLIEDVTEMPKASLAAHEVVCSDLNISDLYIDAHKPLDCGSIKLVDDDWTVFNRHGSVAYMDFKLDQSTDRRIGDNLDIILITEIGIFGQGNPVLIMDYTTRGKMPRKPDIMANLVAVQGEFYQPSVGMHFPLVNDEVDLRFCRFSEPRTANCPVMISDNRIAAIHKLPRVSTWKTLGVTSNSMNMKRLIPLPKSDGRWILTPTIRDIDPRPNYIQLELALTVHDKLKLNQNRPLNSYNLRFLLRTIVGQTLQLGTFAIEPTWRNETMKIFSITGQIFISDWAWLEIQWPELPVDTSPVTRYLEIVDLATNNLPIMRSPPPDIFMMDGQVNIRVKRAPYHAEIWDDITAVSHGHSSISSSALKVVMQSDSHIYYVAPEMTIRDPEFNLSFVSNTKPRSIVAEYFVTGFYDLTLDQTLLTSCQNYRVSRLDKETIAISRTVVSFNETTDILFTVDNMIPVKMIQDSAKLVRVQEDIECGGIQSEILWGIRRGLRFSLCDTIMNLPKNPKIDRSGQIKPYIESLQYWLENSQLSGTCRTIHRQILTYLTNRLGKYAPLYSLDAVSMVPIFVWNSASELCLYDISRPDTQLKWLLIRNPENLGRIEYYHNLMRYESLNFISDYLLAFKLRSDISNWTDLDTVKQVRKILALWEIQGGDLKHLLLFSGISADLLVRISGSDNIDSNGAVEDTNAVCDLIRSTYIYLLGELPHPISPKNTHLILNCLSSEPNNLPPNNLPPPPNNLTPASNNLTAFLDSNNDGIISSAEFRSRISKTFNGISEETIESLWRNIAVSHYITVENFTVPVSKKPQLMAAAFLEQNLTIIADFDRDLGGNGYRSCGNVIFQPAWISDLSICEVVDETRVYIRFEQPIETISQSIREEDQPRISELTLNDVQISSRILRVPVHVFDITPLGAEIPGFIGAKIRVLGAEFVRVVSTCGLDNFFRKTKSVAVALIPVNHFKRDCVVELTALDSQKAESKTTLISTEDGFDTVGDRELQKNLTLDIRQHAKSILLGNIDWILSSQINKGLFTWDMTSQRLISVGSEIFMSSGSIFDVTQRNEVAQIKTSNRDLAISGGIGIYDQESGLKVLFPLIVEIIHTTVFSRLVEGTEKEIRDILDPVNNDCRIILFVQRYSALLPRTSEEMLSTLKDLSVLRTAETNMIPIISRPSQLIHLYPPAISVNREEGSDIARVSVRGLHFPAIEWSIDDVFVEEGSEMTLYPAFTSQDLGRKIRIKDTEDILSRELILASDKLVKYEYRKMFSKGAALQPDELHQMMVAPNSIVDVALDNKDSSIEEFLKALSFKKGFNLLKSMVDPKRRGYELLGSSKFKRSLQGSQGLLASLKILFRSTLPTKDIQKSTELENMVLEFIPKQVGTATDFAYQILPVLEQYADVVTLKNQLLNEESNHNFTTMSYQLNAIPVGNNAYLLSADDLDNPNPPVLTLKNAMPLESPIFRLGPVYLVKKIGSPTRSNRLLLEADSIPIQTVVKIQDIPEKISILETLIGDQYTGSTSQLVDQILGQNLAEYVKIGYLFGQIPGCHLEINPNMTIKTAIEVLKIPVKLECFGLDAPAFTIQLDGYALLSDTLPNLFMPRPLNNLLSSKPVVPTIALASVLVCLAGIKLILFAKTSEVKDLIRDGYHGKASQAAKLWPHVFTNIVMPTANQREEVSHLSEAMKSSMVRSTYGDNRTTYGDNRSTYGDNRSTYGDNRTTYGDNRTTYGDNRTTYGDNRTTYGDNRTTYGDGQSVVGDVRTLLSDYGRSFAGGQTTNDFNSKTGGQYGTDDYLGSCISSVEGMSISKLKYFKELVRDSAVGSELYDEALLDYSEEIFDGDGNSPVCVASEILACVAETYKTTSEIARRAWQSLNPENRLRAAVTVNRLFHAGRARQSGLLNRLILDTNNNNNNNNNVNGENKTGEIKPREFGISGKPLGFYEVGVRGEKDDSAIASYLWLGPDAQEIYILSEANFINRTCGVVDIKSELLMMSDSCTILPLLDLDVILDRVQMTPIPRDTSCPRDASCLRSHYSKCEVHCLSLELRTTGLKYQVFVEEDSSLSNLLEIEKLIKACIEMLTAEIESSINQVQGLNWRSFWKACTDPLESRKLPSEAADDSFPIPFIAVPTIINNQWFSNVLLAPDKRMPHLYIQTQKNTAHYRDPTATTKSQDTTTTTAGRPTPSTISCTVASPFRLVGGGNEPVDQFYQSVPNLPLTVHPAAVHTNHNWTAPAGPLKGLVATTTLSQAQDETRSRDFAEIEEKGLAIFTHCAAESYGIMDFMNFEPIPTGDNLSWGGWRNSSVSWSKIPLDSVIDIQLDDSDNQPLGGFSLFNYSFHLHIRNGDILTLSFASPNMALQAYIHCYESVEILDAINHGAKINVVAPLNFKVTDEPTDELTDAGPGPGPATGPATGSAAGPAGGSAAGSAAAASASELSSAAPATAGPAASELSSAAPRFGDDIEEDDDDDDDRGLSSIGGFTPYRPKRPVTPVTKILNQSICLPGLTYEISDDDNISSAALLPFDRHYWLSRNGLNRWLIQELSSVHLARVAGIRTTVLRYIEWVFRDSVFGVRRDQVWKWDGELLWGGLIMRGLAVMVLSGIWISVSPIYVATWWRCGILSLVAEILGRGLTGSLSFNRSDYVDSIEELSLRLEFHERKAAIRKSLIMGSLGILSGIIVAINRVAWVNTWTSLVISMLFGLALNLGVLPIFRVSLFTGVFLYGLKNPSVPLVLKLGMIRTLRNLYRIPPWTKLAYPAPILPKNQVGKTQNSGFNTKSPSYCLEGSIEVVVEASQTDS